MSFNFNYRKTLITGYSHAIIAGVSSVLVFSKIASGSNNSDLGFLGVFLPAIALTQFGLSLVSGTTLRKLTRLVQESKIDDAKTYIQRMFSFFLSYSLITVLIIAIVDFFFGVNPLKLPIADKNHDLYLFLFYLNILLFSTQSLFRNICLSVGNYPLVNTLSMLSSIFVVLWCFLFQKNLIFSYFVAYTLSSAVTAFILYKFARKNFSGVSLKLERKMALKDMLSFQDSFSAIFSILLTNEIVLLGWIVGLSVAGEYNRNWKYPELFIGLILKMFEQMYPVLTGFYKGSEKTKTIVKTSLIVSLLGFFIFSVFYLYLGDILSQMFLGEKIGFSPSLQVLMLLLLPLLLIDKICFNLRYPTGETTVANGLSLFVLILKVLLCVLFRDSGNFLMIYLQSTIVCYLVLNLPYGLYTIRKVLRGGQSV